MKIKDLFDKTLLKFFCVGVINTLVGTTIMFAAYNILHFGFIISTVLNYAISSTVSFFLNKKFTFKSNQRSWKLPIKFALNIAVCYVISHSVAKPVVSLLLQKYGIATQDNFAMLVALGLFVILNYLGQRLFVFKNAQ